MGLQFRRDVGVDVGERQRRLRRHYPTDHDTATLESTFTSLLHNLDAAGGPVTDVELENHYQPVLPYDYEDQKEIKEQEFHEASLTSWSIQQSTPGGSTVSNE